jgi:hypothetical protein
MLVGASKSISGFDPRSIVGCSLWLDGADTATMNSTPTVTTWTDKSGQGNNVVGTATYSSGTMTFNGTNQAFSNTAYVFPSNAYSMFAVYSNTTAPGATSYMNVVYGSGGYPMLGVYGSSKFVSARSVVANTGALSPNIVASNVLVSATYTPSTFSPFINGSAETTLAGTTLAATGIYVGGPTNYFNGSVSEILIYSATLTSTQRQSVEGYLTWKWGLQVQVPAPVSSPPSISGCVLWLDAADTSTLTLSTNNVTQWSDKSGLSNNATQTTTSLQPTTGGSQNGLNTLLFTGKMMTYPTISLSAQTVFCVYLNNTFTPYGWPVHIGPFAFFYAAPSSNVGIGRAGYTGEVSANWSTNGLTTSNYTVYGGTVSVSGSTTSVLYFNGNQVASNTVASSGGIVYYTIGTIQPGANTVTGYIAEVIVFNSVLGTTQRQSVENYLMGKWGIKPSLPATHPFYSLPAFSRVFGPLDIPGCSLWLDAADASTISFSSGTTISNWTDKSGNGYNATPYGTGTTVTYNSSSNAVYFPGSAGVKTSLVTPANRVQSGFFVATVSSTNVGVILGCSNATGGREFRTTGTLMSLKEYTIVLLTSGTTPVNTLMLVGYTDDGTTITHSVNGTTTSGTSATQFTSGTTVTLGYSYNAEYMVGYINEAIIFSNALSSTQRQQVEGYLAAKWGLLNDLPSKVLSPLNIPGCALWLDAADATTFTYSSGSNVSQWSDKSGTANHAVRGIWGTFPTRTSSNTVRFSNNGTTTQYLNTQVGRQTTQAVTFAMVVKILSSTGYFLDMRKESTGYIIATMAGNVILARDLTNPLISINYTQTLNTPLIIFYQSTLNTVSVYVNGTLIASSTAALNNSAADTKYTTIGALTDIIDTSTSQVTYSASSEFSELLMFNAFLTTPQRQSVENYLMSKWGISNVTSHPFKSIPPSTSQPPQFQEVTPGNWKYDWQPYLSNLAAANSSGVTVTTSTITGGATYITNGWFGAVVGLDGNVYFTPSNAANILKLNVATGVTTNITGGATYTTGGWCGGVLAPDGKIYFCPQNATNFLVLNTTTGVTSNVAGSATYTSGGWAGGLLGQDGNIYCCPLGANNILKLDPRTGVTTNITGGATYTGTGWALGQVGSDGNIYFAPVYATNYLKLNPITGVTTNVTGGATIASDGYRGGTLGLDGNIYTAPYTDPRIMKLNTTTGVVSFITGGASMSGTAWQGGVLAADGNIYFIPNTASSLIKLNTSTNVTTNITGGATYTSRGWTCGVLAPDGNIYCSPYFSSSILKVTFSGLSQLPSLRYCVSPYPNHL